MGHSVIHLESHLQPAGIHAASDGDLFDCAGGEWQDEHHHRQSKEPAPQWHNIREQFARVLEKLPEGCPIVTDIGQARHPGYGASQGRISGDQWCTRLGIDLTRLITAEFGFCFVAHCRLGCSGDGAPRLQRHGPEIV